MIGNKMKHTFKLVWKSIVYMPWLFAASILLWSLVFVYNLVPGFIAREYFNKLFDGGNTSSLVWILAMFAGVVAARVVIGYFGAVTYYMQSFIVSALVRRNMFEIIFKKHAAEAIPMTSGKALNCINDDVEQLVDTIGYILDTVGTAIFSIIAIIILVSINPLITVLVVTPLVVVVLLSRKANNRIEKYRRASRSISSEISGFLGEIFNAVQVVKASGNEKTMVKHLNKLNRERHSMMLKDTLFTQLLDSLYDNIVNIGTGLVLILIASSMKAGSFKVGDFALFVYYLAFVSDFIMRCGSFLAYLKKTEVSVNRIEELLQITDAEVLFEKKPIYTKGDVPEQEYAACKDHDILKSLEVRNLSYNYPDSIRGINNINFKIDRGSMNVITGRIGSGKSTLLKVLLGLLPVGSGTICWNGKHVENPDMFFIPPRTAYAPQVPHLFSDTIKNNILLGIPEEEADLKGAIYSAVMEQDIEGFENGEMTEVGSMGAKLSGGQIQRVAAARMFVRKPDLLVLDDISSALDVETENILCKRLSEKKSATYLIVSNKKAILKQADNIIVLKDGGIEANGTFEELLECSEEFRNICGEYEAVV